ncbi:MAG: L-glutamate gamma-semialdehyde dehydrogenase [Bacteroidetes bacterium]|nr:L-glutamate gamma-semialdehyde dehydrogenase [Bacteroidota bacterium]
MMNGTFKIPVAVNEPIKQFEPGSLDREKLKQTIKEMRSQVLDIPMYIGDKEVRTGKKVALTCPHDHKHILGYYHKGDKTHVKQAIAAAMKAKKKWAEMSWEHRAAIFLKAAELLAGPYRYKIVAATMLGQSKNVYQAEIDSACESIDFLRFNVKYMTEIYAQQVDSTSAMWNRLEWRPLEGFIWALTPFNFTAIGLNLTSSCAMMGNTIVWKQSNTAIFSAYYVMEVFRKAGLPDGVINWIHCGGAETADVVLNSPDFGGIHFTGSTEVFRSIWKKIGENIHIYKSYPRIVGETGGKDFIIGHKSADPKVLATAILRGAFEFQGQKCSACSRAYIPSNLWKEVKKIFTDEIASMKVGPTEDLGNFINAVIDETSFNNIASYIDRAKKDRKDAQVIIGGNYDKSKGYFIEPTIIQAKNPAYRTMCEEIFGPVLTIHVYDENKFEKTLDLVNNTSPYALTGAIIAQDRLAITLAEKKLVHAAGNFYINDKCTGAVVGQQPFGGSRASGTCDKAGHMINLLRWVAPRTIKELFVPPTDYRYPFLEPDKKQNGHATEPNISVKKKELAKN